MINQVTFGQHLRELRKAQGLTQRELSDRVAERLKDEDRRGFDVTYLSKIENDRLAPPSTAAIMQLAAVLEADSDELLALAKKAPTDIGETLQSSKGARRFYRSAVNKNLTEEEWEKLEGLLDKLKQGDGE